MKILFKRIIKNKRYRKYYLNVDYDLHNYLFEFRHITGVNYIDAGYYSTINGTHGYVYYLYSHNLYEYLAIKTLLKILKEELTVETILLSHDIDHQNQITARLGREIKKCTK